MPIQSILMNRTPYKEGGYKIKKYPTHFAATFSGFTQVQSVNPSLLYNSLKESLDFMRPAKAFR